MTSSRLNELKYAGLFFVYLATLIAIGIGYAHTISPPFDGEWYILGVLLIWGAIFIGWIPLLILTAIGVIGVLLPKRGREVRRYAALMTIVVTHAFVSLVTLSMPIPNLVHVLWSGLVVCSAVVFTPLLRADSPS